MLQRIQSFYLFLVVVFTLLFIFLPLATLEVGSTLYKVKPWGISPGAGAEGWEYNGLLGIVSLISAFVVIVASVFTTFQYKNRPFQIKLGKLNILINVMLVVSVLFYLDSIRNLVQSGFSFGVGVIFPLLSMLLILMANRAIKKDEELVRSADRLR